MLDSIADRIAENRAKSRVPFNSFVYVREAVGCNQTSDSDGAERCSGGSKIISNRCLFDYQASNEVLHNGNTRQCRWCPACRYDRYSLYIPAHAPLIAKVLNINLSDSGDGYV